MKSRTAEETMCILTGAALGAAALYFLDPLAGQRRRHSVAKMGGQLVDDALGFAKTGANALSGRATNLAHQLQAGHHTQQLMGQAHDITADLTQRANAYLRQNRQAAINAGHELGHGWMDSARHAYDQARGAAYGYADLATREADDLRHLAARGISRASHRAQSWLGHEEREGFGLGTILSSTVGCCAVGAGIMYFFDPERGRSRRSWIIKEVSGAVRQSGRGIRGIGQDIADQVRGVVGKSSSSARSLANRARIDSEQLVRRIRSEVAQFSPRADQVQFMADADGVVTATGNIAGDEVDRLLRFLHGLPGVNHVVNRMNVGNVAESQPSAAFQ